jgi:hypothetical protein
MMPTRFIEETLESQKGVLEIGKESTGYKYRVGVTYGLYMNPTSTTVILGAA